MKKLVLLLAVVFSVSLFSCTNTAETTEATVDSAIEATVDSAAAVVDTAAQKVDSAAAAVVDSAKQTVEEVATK